MPNPTPTHIKRLETLEDAITAISGLSNTLEKLETALKHVTRYHRARVVWHCLALVLEVTGTIFVLLGAIQFSGQVPSSGIVPSDVNGYQAWYHHREVLGIVFYFPGFWPNVVLFFSNPSQSAMRAKHYSLRLRFQRHPILHDLSPSETQRPKAKRKCCNLFVQVIFDPPGICSLGGLKRIE